EQSCSHGRLHRTRLRRRSLLQFEKRLAVHEVRTWTDAETTTSRGSNRQHLLSERTRRCCQCSSLRHVQGRDFGAHQVRGSGVCRAWHPGQCSGRRWIQYGDASNGCEPEGGGGPCEGGRGFQKIRGPSSGGTRWQARGGRRSCLVAL